MKISIKRTISGLTMTNLAHLFGLLIITTALAACGGGTPTPPTPPTPPATPENLSATLGTNTITLIWTAASGAAATYYNINRSGGADRADMRETDASHTDNSVIEGNEYTYQVIACNHLGCSTPASLVVDYSAPNTPMNLVASHSGNNVTITWGDVTGATYYNIARNGTFNNVNVTALTYTDATVMQGMTYTYMVSACNQVDCSPPASLMVDYSAPNTPMNLVASHSGNIVTLQWGDVTGATYYNISRDNVELNADVTALTYPDTTVMQGMTYTYMVSACNQVDCSPPISAIFRLVLITADDTDGDGVDNSIDVDNDGDGLIEIDTAQEFNAVRNNLDGTGLIRTPGAESDSNGCGGATNSNGAIITTACSGYELMADINLNGTSGTFQDSNWQPLGGCIDNSCGSDNQSILFAADFNGNGYIIANLTINTTETNYGVGLFGAIAPSASISNVSIRNASITAPNSASVGVLVGWAKDATISSSSVIANQITGTSNVGGLVGSGDGATISSSSVVVANQITGTFRIGGLVGSGDRATISSSSVVANQVNGSSGVGGLVGSGQSMTISSSSVDINQITGSSSSVGGLVGSGHSAMISSSSAAVNQITGVDNIGGLVGLAEGATISSSSVVVNQVTGSGEQVGGLVGWGFKSMIRSSSVIANQITGVDDVGGLAGDVFDSMISSSSAAVYQITGAKNVGGLLGYGVAAVINSSLAITNQITGVTNFRELVGDSGGSMAFFSYWDNGVTLMRFIFEIIGSGLSTSALQTPANTTGFAGGGIYATWDNGYCNPTTGTYRAGAAPDFQRAWDLGTDSEYPALTCLPNLPLDQQRMVRAAALAGDSPVDKYKELTSNR